MDRSTTRTAHILLVEDSPGDARLTQEALAAGKICNTVHHVTDGVQALDFLMRRGAHEHAPRPDLILLDINLPKLSGQEVLAEINKHDDIRRIPVVVLTTSQAETDILTSYNLNANCYISKPVDFQQFVDVISVIEEFWLEIVVLPPLD